MISCHVEVFPCNDKINVECRSDTQPSPSAPKSYIPATGRAWHFNYN